MFNSGMDARMKCLLLVCEPASLDGRGALRLEDFGPPSLAWAFASCCNGFCDACGEGIVQEPARRRIAAA